ncbi:MAG: macro domain-containing protein [Rhodospirillales bacterium]|nr:macro domain-containing protein [Rhodospirillales bacterium]
MIYKLKGDILLSQAQAIAHGVAPGDHFHSGLALALREAWPAMYKDFRHYSHQNHPKAGGVWMWGGAGGRVIVALLTQEEPRDEHSNPGKASHHTVNLALKALRALIEKENIASVALPRLATGVGGMDWADVEPLIHQHLGDLEASVFVYETYVKDAKADEPVSGA